MGALVSNTLNGFNIGTDTRLAISDQFGDVFTDAQLGHLTAFNAESEDHMLKITPITTGGVPLYQTIWNGLKGSLKFVRVGPNFQQMFMDLMGSYFNNGQLNQFQIAQTVLNRDGSIDEYLYTGVQFMKPRFGNFASVKEVDMQLDFNASQVNATGTLAAFLSSLPI